MNLFQNLFIGTLISVIQCADFPRPNIIGINDQSFVNTKGLNSADLESRNDKLQTDINPSVHEYNAFWESFENSGVMPSSSPVDCPTGYIQFPPDASGLKSNGGRYNHLHCYSEGTIDIFKAFLSSDYDHDWESAGVVWCAPVIFRDPNCLGMPAGSAEAGPKNYSSTYADYIQTLSGTQAQIESYHYSPATDNPLADNATKPDGAVIESAFDASGCSCVPKDEFMPDFQDFAVFLGNDLMNGEAGRFKHFVVWNENANSVWFDLSPTISTISPITPADQQLWINKYAAMISAFSDSVPSDSYVYASIDRWFGVPPVLTTWNIGRVHIGSENLITGLWDVLGTKTDWSLALHPYGSLYAQEFNFENQIVSAYDAATISDVAAFQRQQLQRIDPSALTDPNDTPQLVIALTEQGFPSSDPENSPDGQALKICQFHDIVIDVPGLYYVAHNDFQNSGSDQYGLVPADIDPTLTNSDSAVTYKAYMATNPVTWKKDPTNYCCSVNSSLGCP